jgi:PAS domain S-box-containing protein
MRDPSEFYRLRSGRNDDSQLKAAALGPEGAANAARENEFSILAGIAEVIEHDSHAVFLFDRCFCCLYANRKASLFLQKFRKDSPVQWNLRELAQEKPELLKVWLRKIQQVFRTGRQMRFEQKWRLPNQKVFEIQCIPLGKTDGQVRAAALICRDTTLLRKLQQQLKEEEHRFRDLYHQSPVALYRTRLEDGKLLECNKALAALLGYSSVEECKANHYSVDHYVQPQQRQILLNRLHKEKSVKDFELQIRRADNKEIWVELTAELYPEEGWIEGAMREITAAKVLTETEKQILNLIMQGKSSRQIARQLYRSVRTIEDHRAHIMHKLQARNLVELTVRAQTLK